MQANIPNQYKVNFRSCGLSHLTGVSVARYFLILFALLFFSCKNYPDPSIEKLASFSFSYNNQLLVAEGGEYLKDSMYIKVSNQLAPQEIQNFKVDFSVVSGGGALDDYQLVTDARGMATTRWKLGNESNSQTISAKIYDPQGSYLTQISINAYAMMYNTWNQMDFYPLSTVSDVASDTVNHRSWLISLGKVYQRGTNFWEWQQMEEPDLEGAREIEMDKNGVIYIANWYGELFKSSDHGQSWIQCANPIPERPYYFFFWITSDGDLWATHYERGLWHSKDGGETWLNPVSVSGTYFNMNGVYRLKNGWLLSQLDITGVKTVIMKSEDDGKTWLPLPTPDYPYSFYVTENDEIIVFTQLSAGIYKSGDLGKSYKQVHSGATAFSTGSDQRYVQKFDSFYYMAVPGFGVLRTQNFEQFETIFSQPNINGLYIDHTGTIVVKGWLDKLNRSFFYGRK